MIAVDVIFAVDQVQFSYPGQGLSLNGVSFTVTLGERVALLGANGSGKSTLLHLLDGLYFPTSGTVAAFGQVLTEEVLEQTAFGRRFRQVVGFLFQNSEAQLFCPTVEDELAFAPLQLRLPKAEVRQRIEDILELMEIAHLRHRAPQSLSHGEKKRVALASLLVVNPAVLLLDEPTAGLDPRSQVMLLELLERFHQAGLTCITATHDLTLMPHLADRVLVLSEDHRLVADGPVAAILANTALLHEVNLIHAHRHRHGDLIHAHPHPHVLGHDHSHAAP